MKSETDPEDVLVVGEVGSLMSDDSVIYDDVLMTYQPIVPYSFKKRACMGRDPRDGVFLCCNGRINPSIWNMSLNPNPFNDNKQIKYEYNDKIELSINIIRRVKCRDKFIQMMVGKIVNECVPYMEVSWMQQYIHSFIRWESSENIFTSVKFTKT